LPVPGGSRWPAACWRPCSPAARPSSPRTNPAAKAIGPPPRGTTTIDQTLAARANVAKGTAIGPRPETGSGATVIGRRPIVAKAIGPLGSVGKRIGLMRLRVDPS
jgi:hypothetical protein